MNDVNVNRNVEEAAYVDLNKIKLALASKRQTSSPNRQPTQKSWIRVAELLVGELSQGHAARQTELELIEKQIAVLSGEIQNGRAGRGKVTSILDSCEEIVGVARPILKLYPSTQNTLALFIEACKQRAAWEATKENCPNEAPMRLLQSMPTSEPPIMCDQPLTKTMAAQVQQMIENFDKMLEGFASVRSGMVSSLHSITLKARNEYAAQLASHLVDEIMNKDSSLSEQTRNINRALALFPLTEKVEPETEPLRRKLGKAIVAITKRQVQDKLAQIRENKDMKTKLMKADEIGELIDHLRMNRTFFCFREDVFNDLNRWEAEMIRLFPVEQNQDMIQIRRLVILSNDLRGLILYSMKRDDQGNVLPECQERLQTWDDHVRSLRQEISALERLPRGHDFQRIKKATADLHHLGTKIFEVFAKERVAGEFTDIALVHLNRAEKGLKELNTNRPRSQIWIGSNLLLKMQENKAKRVGIENADIDTTYFELDGAFKQFSSAAAAGHTAAQIQIAVDSFDISEKEQPAEVQILSELLLIKSRLKALNFFDAPVAGLKFTNKPSSEGSGSFVLDPPERSPQANSNGLDEAGETIRSYLFRFYEGKRADMSERSLLGSQVRPEKILDASQLKPLKKDELIELIDKLYQLAVDIKSTEKLSQPEFEEIELQIECLKNLL